MNEITYTYEIVSVNEAGRCMEVVYSSEGRQTTHVGARLPFEGEPLEDVIKAFAPVPFWREQELAVVVPQIGVTGTIVDAPQVIEAPQPVQAPEIPVTVA